MKICFLLQRRFVFVGHALAVLLKEKYGVKNFCAYVYVRDGFNFLTRQKEISYTKLLLDEDIHKQHKNEKIDYQYLAWLEREYGLPNLWPYIEIDRIIRFGQLVREYPHDTPLYSHEEMLKILQVKAKAIISFLEEEKPDAVMFSVIGATGSMLLYHIARKMGIKTLIIEQTRIGNLQTLSNNYKNFSYVNASFEEMKKAVGGYAEYKEAAEKIIAEFREQPRPYAVYETPEKKAVNRKKHFRFLLPSQFLRSLRWLLEMSRLYFTSGIKDDYSTIKPRHYLWDKIRRKLRVLTGFERFYGQPDLKNDFAFFPLHYEPEISLLLRAPFFTDQLWLIKQIARSLPVSYKLYLKEHPSMFGYRPRRFYEELKKIPNVKLVPPHIESFPLIENAKLILTITGTAGLEAVMLKKPVITFGDVFYTELPMVKRCKEIEKLPELIKEQLENFSNDENALIDFIAHTIKESANVDLIQIWEIEGAGRINEKRRELLPLVDLIAKKLGIIDDKNGG